MKNTSEHEGHQLQVKAWLDCEPSVDHVLRDATAAVQRALTTRHTSPRVCTALVKLMYREYLVELELLRSETFRHFRIEEISGMWEAAADALRGQPLPTIDTMPVLFKDLVLPALRLLVIDKLRAWDAIRKIMTPPQLGMVEYTPPWGVGTVKLHLQWGADGKAFVNGFSWDVALNLVTQGCETLTWARDMVAELQRPGPELASPERLAEVDREVRLVCRVCGAERVPCTAYCSVHLVQWQKDQRRGNEGSAAFALEQREALLNAAAGPQVQP